LSPGWGFEAPGAATQGDLLLGAPGVTGRQFAGAAAELGGRIDARVSWGAPMTVAMRRGFLPGGVLRPYADLSLGETSASLRTGVALEGPVRLELSAEGRREGAEAGTRLGVKLSVEARF